MMPTIDAQLYSDRSKSRTAVILDNEGCLSYATYLKNCLICLMPMYFLTKSTI